MSNGQATPTPGELEEMRMGAANATLTMPKDPTQRREIFLIIDRKRDEEKEGIKEVKEDVDLKGSIQRAIEVFGASKKALKIRQVLVGMSPGDRAVVLTQVALMAKDEGWLEKDLVALAADAEKVAGNGVDQGSIFDKTDAAKATGTAKTGPRLVETAPEAPEPAPTPGMDLAEAQKQYEANLAEAQQKYEAAIAKWDGKGRKPPYLNVAAKRLREAEEARVAAEAVTGSDVPSAPARVVSDDDFDEDPAPQEAEQPAAPFQGAEGEGTYTLSHH